MQNFNTIIGVLRLRQQEVCYRVIKQRFGIGDSTVTLILKRFKELGKSYEELANGDPVEVQEMFYPQEAMRRSNCPMPDYQRMYERINAKGSKVNISYCWIEYKKEHPDGYEQTQFYELFNRFVQKNYGMNKVSMAVERVPGEKMYIDWVGDQPEIYLDAQTGELKKVHVFVTTLGFSSYAYSEVFPDETLPNFLKGVVNALHFYGAVPKYLVPDNLKAAVTSHKHEELILNAAFQDLESFYETIVVPPPPRKPKGKSTVENQVRTYETHLIEKLKESVYTSFSEINAACREIIADINSWKKKGFKENRRELFEKYDRPNMKPLSPGMFTTCDYAFFDKVPDNYHLKYDDHYYSVSYKQYKHPAILKATFNQIIITDEHNRVIAIHKRIYEDFPLYCTADEHMHPDHKFYKTVNMRDGNYYRHRAESIGPYTLEFIDRLLTQQRHEETAYNSCNGILNLNGGNGRELFEAAAKRCLDMHSIGYKAFKSAFNYIKDHKTAQLPLSLEGNALPVHKNIRGKDEYK